MDISCDCHSYNGSHNYFVSIFLEKSTHILEKWHHGAIAFTSNTDTLMSKLKLFEIAATALKFGLC